LLNGTAATGSGKKATNGTQLANPLPGADNTYEISTTNLFVSTTDRHLQAANTWGAGPSDATYGAYVPQFDIDGDERTGTTASAGVDEPVASAAPTLTSPTATDITATGATTGFTTDAGNGTAWVVVTSSATKPTAGQVKAGQDHTGAPALHADSKSVTAIGAQSFPAWSGGQPLTEYHFHFVHNGDTSV
jgi:hypothetical protein